MIATDGRPTVANYPKLKPNVCVPAVLLAVVFKKKDALERIA